MSKPDNELIAEVMMYSEGFAHAKALAAKRRPAYNLVLVMCNLQLHAGDL